MISVDPSELAQWAARPDASYILPELIRRLIFATTPAASLVDIPSGSSVRLPGWDGLLETNAGNPWVPEGTSAWELSCEGNTTAKTTAKASLDYNKRTADPEGFDPAATTYVFATPRTWSTKQKWVNKRRGEKKWRDVRALNASDLASWIEQAPAVAAWLAGLTGKLSTARAVSLDEWWENWSGATDPKLSPELMLAGRIKQARQLGAWIEGDPSQAYIQGETRDEAIAFFAASATAESESWGLSVFSRALVVETADAWHGLERHPFPLLLVRAFGGDVSLRIAIEHGHHVLVPLDEFDETRGNGYRLPRVGREEAVAALVGMGISEERSHSLSRMTARHLQVLRRQLIESAGGPTPEWATPDAPHTLVALVLVGQWADSAEGDKKIIERIVGRPYRDVAQELAGLAQRPDSPVVKVGDKWRFVSQEEAWHLLAPRLTGDDLDRFKETASNVLGTVSPAFELPIEERYMASIKGTVLPHSFTIRSGMARSLALMGARFERVVNVPVAKHIAPQVLTAALGGGKGWQIWATLSRDLATLAEAAPEALLDAIDGELAGEPSAFVDLFNQEGDGIFGGAFHAGLLWALERLAWSPDYYSRAAVTLARLAQLDPGGRFSNRPAESLRAMFLPWIRFSEVSDDYRLESLGMILNAVPDAGWRLLIDAYPKGNGFVTSRTPPSWRTWELDAVRPPTHGDVSNFAKALSTNLLQQVGTDAKRWADLVEIIQDLPGDVRHEAIQRLVEGVESMMEHSAVGELWAKVRTVLHHHRSHPDAGWAMPPIEIEMLDSAYTGLTPSDLIEANAWLFDNWRNLPEGMSYDHKKDSERISEAQKAAVNAIFHSIGSAGVFGIANTSELPSQVGLAVGLGLDSDTAPLALALQHLGSSNRKLQEFARSTFTGLFSRSGWSPLEQALSEMKATGAQPEILSDIYLSAPANQETWQRLGQENVAVQAAYWHLIPWFRVAESAAEVSFAAQQFVDSQRSNTAAELLAHTYEAIASEIVIRVLDRIPDDLGQEHANDRKPQISGHNIARLFEKLDRSPDVSESTIANLELPYVGSLEHDRPNLVLYKQVTNDASTFADLIALAFKSDKGPEDNDAGVTVTQSNRATTAFNILWRLRGLPGLRENSDVDAESLNSWVDEARRLCSERGRFEIGDDQIGHILANAPPDVDGTWPCQPVRNVLDRCKSEAIGVGFTIGKRNLRGVTSRNVFDGGGQERDLASEFRKDAGKLAARWPYTAQLLRKIAESYESDGRGHDDDAEWRDQFES